MSARSAGPVCFRLPIWDLTLDPPYSALTIVPRLNSCRLVGRGPPSTWYMVDKGACCLAPCARVDSMTIAEINTGTDFTTFGGRLPLTQTTCRVSQGATRQ